MGTIKNRGLEELQDYSHIDAISKKISAALAVLERVSPIVPLKTRQNMYNALVMPDFNYCNPVWGNIGICSMEQNQAAAQF